MPDSFHRSEQTAAETVEQSLDELLGDAVVYEAGHEPPEPEAVATSDSFDDDLSSAAPRPREARVSPLFWAAAVVWNLPGGMGGWWLLRKTHPRTARKLLFTGVIALLVIGAIVIAMIVTQRRLNPDYVFIRK